MQLICEGYNLMKDCLGMSHDEMSEAFKKWNKTELDSYLMEISANILAYKDADGKPLVEKIKYVRRWFQIWNTGHIMTFCQLQSRDTAGQKGTGKWTAISALDYGMPVTLIGEAVFARCLSSLKGGQMAVAKF